MLKTLVVHRKLRDLTVLDPANGHENARFMKPAQYRRLVENIKTDGCLTTAPLIGKIAEEPGIEYVVSGNHRVQAAIDAGIEEVDCILVKDPLPRSKFVALQLSHNAIEGEDDKAVMQRLYESLDLAHG